MFEIWLWIYFEGDKDGIALDRLWCTWTDKCLGEENEETLSLRALLITHIYKKISGSPLKIQFYEEQKSRKSKKGSGTPPYSTLVSSHLFPISFLFVLPSYPTQDDAPSPTT